MTILVTGTAGFIGFHLTNRLVQMGHTVVGIDSLNDYYDVNLKYNRLAAAGIDRGNISYNKPCVSTLYPAYTFYKLHLENKDLLQHIFTTWQPEIVINLAAQAGVRYSLSNPDAYISGNIVGFTNILECCRHSTSLKHLVYASSSSVYGLNDEVPFTTSQHVDHPISLYAASKKSNELMAHVYSHLFQVPTTGLRFFTVYGPWGRPDMALFLFTNAITAGKPIKVFNNGNMQRDFTYVDDIVEGIVRVMQQPPQANPAWVHSTSDPSASSAPYKIYNIGHSAPVRLLDFIEAVEQELGVTAQKEMLPLQPGDVISTYADVSDLVRDVGYRPTTTVQEGVKKFIAWYKEYHNI